MIAILFYLLPAFTVVMTEDERLFQLPTVLNFFKSLFEKLYALSLFTKIFVGFLTFLLAFAFFGIIFGLVVALVVLATGIFFHKWQAATVSLLVLCLLIGIFNLWRADVNYKQGTDASDSNNPGSAYNSLLRAYDLNPREPLYRSELGNAAASAALALADTDATKSGELKEDAIVFTQSALDQSPANVSLWRTAIRTDYELSLLDSNFDKQTLDTIDHTISLAPTDPKLYYNKGLILSQENQWDQAISAMKKAVELKPDYREAELSLADFYTKNKQTDKAIPILNKVLNDIPNDPDAMKQLEEATASTKVSN